MSIKTIVFSPLNPKRLNDESLLLPNKHQKQETLKSIVYFSQFIANSLYLYKLFVNFIVNIVIIIINQMLKTFYSTNQSIGLTKRKRF